MQIVVVGLNHVTSAVALRERFAFPAESLPAALARLGHSVDEGFVLSTCNRTEVYAFAGHAESGVRHVTAFLSDVGGVSPIELGASTYSYAHDAAVRHLFRVAAGLDSMVIGEDQIVMQMKQALDAARAAGTLGSILERLGSSALAAGKRVRSATGIGRSRVSVVSIAVQAADEALGTLRDRRVALVGAGRTGAVAAQHLTAAGAHVTIVARHAGRGRALAGETGASAVPWSGLREALAAADVVISCTSAPQIVIDEATLAAAVRDRGPREPLLCFDLAVPRDIDPAAAAMPGVVLRDMDALARIASASRVQRSAALDAAEQIVEQRVEQFMEWWRGREVVPAIAQLRSRAEEIRDAELERALARLPELTDRGKVVVRGLAARIVNKLLHQPVTTLKNDPEGANMAQIVQYLFGLGADPSRCPMEAADLPTPILVAAAPPEEL
jgi:glutamyl-tRNA reductase